MRPLHHHQLLAAAVLIGLALVPRTGGAEGAPVDPKLCFLNSLDRMTCVVPEETTPGPRYVMQCDVSGKNCTSPRPMPKDLWHPTEEDCRLLGFNPSPLPPAQSSTAPAKEKSRGKDGPSREQSCGTVYPDFRICNGLPPEYSFQGVAAALAAMKQATGAKSLQLHDADRTKKGPCLDTGTHYNVRRGGDRVGSITCCPCCVDTPPRPMGPTIVVRCRIVW